MAKRAQTLHDDVPVFGSAAVTTNVRAGSVTVLAAVAVLAIAAWPFVGAQHAQASRVYVAPVLPDYLWRDRTIAAYEERLRNDAQNQIVTKLLAAQYLQRYRETQDVSDVLRAADRAKRALNLQPQNNAGSKEILASAYTALHRFDTARSYEVAAYRTQPWDSNAPAQMASLDMETGDYARAARDLAIAEKIKTTPTVLSIRARYLELTGRLNQGRVLLREAMQQSDAVADNPAQSRAWYHFRAGELAFSAGDVDEAIRDERDALQIFPGFETAYRALARFCWATRDWDCALDAAKNGAQVLPEPEILGYQADAQSGRGDEAAAAQTRELIFALQRIGNAYRLNDRLLSVYYAEHRIRARDALRIAEREVRARGSEIYAQDTLAWAAAMAGDWSTAKKASQSAMRFDTEDSRLQFHAGMIALHFGRRNEARRRLTKALSLNPQFDPFYTTVARQALGAL